MREKRGGSRTNRRREFKRRYHGPAVIKQIDPELKANRRPVSIFKRFRHRATLGLFIILWGILLYLLSFSPYFNISTIIVEGTDLISIEEVENIVEDQFQYRRWNIFPQTNIFFFPRRIISERLAEKYILQKIEVKRDLPDILVVRLEEKISAVVWVSRGRPYYMDLTGEIITELDGATEHEPVVIDEELVLPDENEKEEDKKDETDEEKKPVKKETETEPELTEVEEKKDEIKTKEVKIIPITLPPLIRTTFPLIYDQSNRLIKLGDKPLDSEKLGCLREVNDKLIERTDLPIKAFIIKENEGSGVKIWIDEGWLIIMSCHNDIERQINNLISVLAEKLPNREVIQYIDLRFDDRVYYK